MTASKKAGAGKGVADDVIETLVDTTVEVLTDTWKVWVPVAVAVGGWWAWTREPAVIDPDTWLTVKRVAVGVAVLAVAAVVARVVVVVRGWTRRQAVERGRDALDAVKVDGDIRVTAADGTGGYVQLARTEHLSDLKRRRLEGALSSKLGADIEVGAPDRKDRAPFHRRPEPVEARDLLAPTIPAIPFPAKVDIDILKRLHVGTQADGRPFLLDLTGGRHTFIAGATGSGKGSVEQSILRQCAPLIHAGLLRVIFVDPKGGIEGVPVRWMCDRVIICRGNNVDEVVEHFQSMVTEMEASAGRVMAMGRRDHVPTREHPATLLIIDEVASLTKYLGTPKQQREIEGAIGALTTQGRAAGWMVAAAVQDPRKEVISIRNLFPQRVALRLAEPLEVDWVLGSAVRERGAECHLIPKNRQGTAYVAQDGDPDPLKVRFSFPTDADLMEMCRRFAAPGKPVVWGLPEGVVLPDAPAGGLDLSKE